MRPRFRALALSRDRRSAIAIAGLAQEVGSFDVSAAPLVGIIMGSRSDWETMRHAADDARRARRAVRGARRLGPPHAGPALRVRLDGRGARACEVIIAGAGGAAHLPGHDRREDRCCPSSACRSSRRRCTASTRCSRSCRCRRASRSGRSRSAGPARSTRRCWPPRSWRATHRELRERLAAFRAQPDRRPCSHDPDPRDVSA